MMGSEDGYNSNNAGCTTPLSTPQTPFTPLPLLNTSRNGNSSSLAREVTMVVDGHGNGNGNGDGHGGGGARKVSIILGQCFAIDTNDRHGDEDPENITFSRACVHPPVPSVSLTRKIGAEFVGTFILIFVATAAVIVDEKTGGSLTIIGNAAAAGLAVMAVILSVGHISGAHLNPCLTLSFAALRKFPWVQVPAYLAAQIVGSICASFALKGIFNPVLHGGVTVPSGTDLQSFVLELVISFNLMFVVTAVATDTRAVGELAAIAVGATVMMNILISGATSGGSMNPVRTLGPAIAANNYKGLWLYMIGPPLGALGGATAYALIRLSDDDPGPSRSVRSFRRSATNTPR